MINPKDFRIGNILQDQLTGKHLIVADLSKENIFFDIHGQDQQPLPEGWQAVPIPITPELLLKCGFVWQKSIHLWKHIQIGCCLFLNDSECMSDLDDCSFKRPKLSSLHQLQNLFFALSGVELFVDL